MPLQDHFLSTTQPNQRALVQWTSTATVLSLFPHHHQVVTPTFTAHIFGTCHWTIWQPHCKCTSHSQHAKWAYRSSLFAHMCQIQPTVQHSYHGTAKCVPYTNIPNKFGIYATYLIGLYERCMHMHVPHIKSLQSLVTYLTYITQQIWSPHCKKMFCCTVNPFALIVYDSTCGINTVRFKCIAKCINLQSLSDAMCVERLVALRCYDGKRVNVVYI